MILGPAFPLILLPLIAPIAPPLLLILRGLSPPLNLEFLEATTGLLMGFLLKTLGLPPRPPPIYYKYQNHMMVKVSI